MLKFQKLRSYIAALLLAALVFSAIPAPVYARQTDFFPELAEAAGDADELKSVGVLPDSRRFYTLQERLLVSNDLQNRDELSLALISYVDEYQRLNADGMLAMYRYYCQPEENRQVYQKWQSMLAGVERDYQATWQELAASDNRPMLEGLVSPAVLARYDDGEAMPDELLAKLRQIKALDSAYWQAINKDYRVDYQGQNYGFGDLEKIEDADDYLAVYKLLAQKRNAETAGLLADIVPVCNEYARALGYADYAEYAYAAVYQRDYTPEQAAQLYPLVKQYIVPLYREVLAAQDANGRFDWQSLAAKGEFDGERLQEIVGRYLPEISDEYAEVFAYMRENGLADIERDEQKLSASFTSYIAYYKLAVLFIGSQSGTPHDLATFIHEFGHFAYYMYEQRDIGYDVGEFYSQGLEALFMHFAEDIFGEDGAAYRLDELASQLRSVIDGCLYDEFQQKLYRLEKPTVAEINRLFHQLAAEYAYAFVHNDDEAYNWVTTAHTFIQPFYYISYAVSGLSACELLGLSRGDFSAAADRYLATATLNEADYTDFARKAGLSDIFTEVGMRKIAAGLRAYFYEDICGIKNLDAVDGHWAAKPLLAAVRVGVLRGDEQGDLRPDKTVSRAEGFAMLWRLYDEETLPAGAGFPDVAAEAWYAGAAGWAQAKGICGGSDGGRFCPDNALTREELVTVLYRLRAAEEAEPADMAALSGFADAAEISPWAREAFAWAVGRGIVSGADGRLNPQQAATRAETAALLLGKDQ